MGSSVRVTYDYSEVNKLREMLSKIGDTFSKKTKTLKKDAAQVFLVQVRKNVTGLPGPNLVTGGYQSSWTLRRLPGGDWVATSGHPASMRLEFGYVGVDSLGRSYMQSPRPHIRPAALVAADYLRRMADKEVKILIAPLR